jgi:methyl-accepting chemotaxis protein
VVASEARALAQRSSEAARKINTLISASGAQVKQGVVMVDQAGAVLNAIAESVTAISQQVAEISASAGEQATGIEGINIAIGRLDQPTQQNVATFEQTSATTQSPSRSSARLAATIARFHGREGTTGTPARSRAA